MSEKARVEEDQEEEEEEREGRDVCVDEDEVELVLSSSSSSLLSVTPLSNDRPACDERCESVRKEVVPSGEEESEVSTMGTRAPARSAVLSDASAWPSSNHSRSRSRCRATWAASPLDAVVDRSKPARSEAKLSPTFPARYAARAFSASVSDLSGNRSDENEDEEGDEGEEGDEDEEEEEEGDETDEGDAEEKRETVDEEDDDAVAAVNSVARATRR